MRRVDVYPPDAVMLDYPLACRARARNSPARRVPSHGTHLMGTTYAIDLIPVDHAGRVARWNWRAMFGTERPHAFVGFGMPVFAPVSGVVVIAHDGEPDHSARRSPSSLLAYAAGQARRVRGGPAAIAGNHVVIALGVSGPFVLVAHLMCGSVGVEVGDRVARGARIGCCGNSGNSTQPHVHLQATDSVAWSTARGLPIAFAAIGGSYLPSESQIITRTGPAAG